MDSPKNYPAHCRKNIRKLMDLLCMDAGTAYRTLLLNAALTDLRPEDEKIVKLILMDCDIDYPEEEVRA